MRLFYFEIAVKPYRCFSIVLAVSFFFTSVSYGQINKALLDELLFQEEVDDTVRVMLSQLPWSTREINAINGVISNTNYLGMSATEDDFKKNAGGHSVIHLATHAFINDGKPMLSKFIFSEDPGSPEDGYLNTYEIFNTNLSADLAVLSACNTGFGQVNRGEGVMSLARAFTYAGCPSLVMSLWPASDRSTAIIMREFYTALGNGMKINTALRHAKLRYLEQVHPDETAPYYWAGFIAIGRMNTVDIQMKGEEQGQWALFTFGSLFLVSLVGISQISRRLWRRIRKKS